MAVAWGLQVVAVALEERLVQVRQAQPSGAEHRIAGNAQEEPDGVQGLRWLDHGCPA